MSGATLHTPTATWGGGGVWSAWWTSSWVNGRGSVKAAWGEKHIESKGVRRSRFWPRVCSLHWGDVFLHFAVIVTDAFLYLLSCWLVDLLMSHLPYPQDRQVILTAITLRKSARPRRVVLNSLEFSELCLGHRNWKEKIVLDELYSHQTTWYFIFKYHPTYKLGCSPYPFPYFWVCVLTGMGHCVYNLHT